MACQSKACNASRKRSGKGAVREERTLSFDFLSHQGEIKVSVVLHIEALKPNAAKLLTEMPPQRSIWPEDHRQDWLKRYQSALALGRFAGVERRLVGAYVELLGATLAVSDRIARQRVSAMPKADLKVVGGYEHTCR